MTDPISGKVAGQAVQGTSGAEGVGGADKAGGDKGMSFDDVMGDVEARHAEQAQGAGQVDGIDKTQQVEQANEIDRADLRTREMGPSEARLKDFMSSVGKDEKKLEAAMKKSLSGAEMSQQDLLRVQATMYAYTQKVELTSKVVSNATSGLKQVMNTQV